MHGKFHVPFFCKGKHDFQKVFQCLPKFFFRDGTILSGRCILHEGVVKTGYNRTTA